MKRYKEGDKVKLIRHMRDSQDNPGLDIGSVGVVTCVNSDEFEDDEQQPYYVDWEGTAHGGWWVCSGCLGDDKPISLENK